MKIFPAIDLYQGQVVRLTKGDYSKMKGYSLSPLEAAQYFMAAGCRSLHVVDLEGAQAGEPRHLQVLEELASLGLFVQYGGGLRSAGAVASALNAGAARVMAGSLIFKDLDRAQELSRRFGQAIMAAVDLKGGKVVHSGWLESTALGAQEALERTAELGFSSFLVTLTEQDGTLQGTDAEIYRPLRAPGRFIAAAGGIATLKDLKALEEAGVSAAVIGKGLYEGGLSLQDLMEAYPEG